MPFEIISITSPTHTINLKKTACQAVLQLTNQSEEFSAPSLLINIRIATVHMPRMLVEDYRAKDFSPTNNPSRACMVSFYPEFETLKLENPTINILIDCSNSMTQHLTKIEQLSKLIINQLPKTSNFNICLFGSDFIELFPFAQKFSTKLIDKAIDWLSSNLKVRRGNTDLLNVLQSMFVFNDYASRQIDYSFNEINSYLLISDGHLTRVNECLATLKNANSQELKKVTNRIFACSVGTSASNHTLKVISHLTGGSYEAFDAANMVSWGEKIEDLMDKMCQPAAIKDIRIEWENMSTNLTEHTWVSN